MSEELRFFVREALAKGIGRGEIRAKLREARWPEDEVESALATFAEVEFPIPVPRPKPYVSARDAFGYLVLFTTLWVSATALIQLVYQFINRAFPDPAANYYALERSLGTLRWSTAALLIAFPVFLWLSRRSYLAARHDPDKRTSKIRKWLTYLTLFVAASVLLCDLITLVYFLLAGEITERFLLKVATVGLVAGSVFGYYLWDLRQDDLAPEQAARRHPGLRVFALGTSAAVIACLVGGLMTTGAPATARMQRLDQQRIQHLQRIASSIDSYWHRHDRLPSDLATLALERTGAPQVIADPATGGEYEYLPSEDDSYQLCAVFDTTQAELGAPGGRDPRFWAHGPGHKCYLIEVNR